MNYGPTRVSQGSWGHADSSAYPTTGRLLSAIEIICALGVVSFSRRFAGRHETAPCRSSCVHTPRRLAPVGTIHSSNARPRLNAEVQRILRVDRRAGIPAFDSVRRPSRSTSGDASSCRPPPALSSLPWGARPGTVAPIAGPSVTVARTTAAPPSFCNSAAGIAVFCCRCNASRPVDSPAAPPPGPARWRRF